MPNPVAVNDLSPISGSLQTSRISYGVETAGKDYGQDYNGTTWYSDIPQNGSQYTIITDNYTANYYVSRSNAGGAYVEGGLPAVDEYSAPVFWLTAGTSSLDIITIVNGLPDRIGQIPFNSGSQALNWIISSSNYFAVGPPYEQIDADQLALCLDASQVISYPTTSSTWYDISGYTNNGTLINGTAWNSTGWFDFDGVDDYIDMGNPTILRNMPSGSVEAIYYRDSSTGTYQMIFTDAGSDLEVTYLGNVLQFYIGNNGVSYTHAVTTNWIHVICTWNTTTKTIYLNGTQVVSNSNPGLTTGNRTRYLGSRAGSYPLVGNIANIRVYSKTLTASDVAQNYYQGPVVTGSISGSYYANNLVSYVTGSTSTYNLSANIISGSLQNGVGFSPLNGGYWSFDGTDDQILLEGSTTSAWTMGDGTLPWTVNAWIRTTSLAAGLGVGGIFSNSSGGPIVSQLGIYNGFISYWYYLSSWQQTNGSTFISDGKWHLLTWVNNSNNTLDFYIDSKYDGTIANSLVANANYLNVIGNTYTGVAFLGDIASLQINKGKAFTASEVLQQYNATK